MYNVVVFRCCLFAWLFRQVYMFACVREDPEVFLVGLFLVVSYDVYLHVCRTFVFLYLCVICVYVVVMIASFLFNNYDQLFASLNNKFDSCYSISRRSWVCVVGLFKLQFVIVRCVSVYTMCMLLFHCSSALCVIIIIILHIIILIIVVTQIIMIIHIVII